MIRFLAACTLALGLVGAAAVTLSAVQPAYAQSKKCNGHCE
ncbi:hypothetical protein LDDCCGHA_5573 [Methylobacterium oxalidis]|nr:hypothetical protein LDDCCGHA_5573 [Methylobacterium oxalidis]